MVRTAFATAPSADLGRRAVVLVRAAAKSATLRPSGCYRLGIPSKGRMAEDTADLLEASGGGGGGSGVGGVGSLAGASRGDVGQAQKSSQKEA